MQSTLIVPRLAAAAFALGLGAAVFSGAGLASAAPTDSSSPGSSTADSTSSEASKNSNPQKSPTDSSSEDSHDSEEPKDSDADGDRDGVADEDIAGDDAADDDVADDDVADDDVADEDVDGDGDNQETANGGVTEDAIDKAGVSDGSYRDDTRTDSDTTDTADSTGDEPDTAEEDVAEAIERPAADNPPAIETPPQHEGDNTPAVATAAGVPVEVRKAPSQWAITVDDFFIRAAAMFGYAPDGPGGPPPLRTLIEEAYAGLRRIVFAGQPNAAPTLTPVQIRQLLSGEVIGDLLPYDHNGDRLTYRVVEGPARGEVTVNANGTYIYTPDRALAGVGGMDTFSVVIDDGRTATDELAVHQITVGVSATVGRWRGYHLDNLTTGDITLYGIRGDTGDYDGPGAGHIIHSASRMNFQVDEYAFKHRDVHLDLAGTAGNWTVSAHVPPSVHSTQPQVQCVSSNAVCDPASTSTGQRAALMSAAVTTVNKDAAVEADVQDIARLLKSYCADGKVATCSFKVTRQDDRAIGNRHQVGNALINPSDEKQSTSISVSDTVSESDSVNVSAKLSGGVLTKLASIINVEITAAYGHSWTNSHTFTQTVTMTVPPHHIGIIYAAQPVYRSWGDFTVKLGNTTYNLKDVYFDTPREDGLSPQGSYVTHTEPITADALAALPPGTTLVVAGSDSAIGA